MAWRSNNNENVVDWWIRWSVDGSGRFFSFMHATPAHTPCLLTRCCCVCITLRAPRAPRCRARAPYAAAFTLRAPSCLCLLLALLPFACKLVDWLIGWFDLVGRFSLICRYVPSPYVYVCSYLYIILLIPFFPSLLPCPLFCCSSPATHGCIHALSPPTHTHHVLPVTTNPACTHHSFPFLLIPLYSWIIIYMDYSLPELNYVYIDSYKFILYSLILFMDWLDPGPLPPLPFPLCPLFTPLHR